MLEGLKMVFEKLKVSSISRRCMGFTLAEVLITLGIIGVVAAMTIPTLISNFQDTQYKVAYKKAYADANNALNLAISKGESYANFSSTADLAALSVNWPIFSSQFNIVRTCTNNDNDQCWDMSGEQSMGAPTQNANGFIDSSGRNWTTYRWQTSFVDDFLVDTNGFKKPNKFGKDRWIFRFALSNSSSGNPVKISSGIYSDPVDYDMNTTEAYDCPTGSCYYKSWLLN